MNGIVILAIFTAAFSVTLVRSAVMGFAWVYIPVMLLLALVSPVQLEPIPDATPLFAAVYGILLGFLMKGGERISLRLNVVDWIIMLLAASAVITSAKTESFYTGVSSFGTQLLGWLTPYFLARLAFQSPHARRTALWVICGCMFFIAAFTLIEVRLWPYFYTKLMASSGLTGTRDVGAYGRFGLFRARVSFQHPIDFGNGCLALMGMIALLATTTSVGLRHTAVRLALCATALGLFSSLSYTAYFGAAATGMFYFLIARIRFVRTHLVFLVLVGISMGCWGTYYLLQQDLSKLPKPHTFESSLWTRTLIVQESWGLVSRAGPWGLGKTITTADITLESVDNAYLLHAMRNGWVYLTLWLLIPVGVGMRANRVFRRWNNWPQIFPLAVAVATILGIMVAMYTVWAGAVYATVWLIMIGFTMSMIDVLLQHAAPRRQSVAQFSRGSHAAVPAQGAS